MRSPADNRPDSSSPPHIARARDRSRAAGVNEVRTKHLPPPSRLRREHRFRAFVGLVGIDAFDASQREVNYADLAVLSTGKQHLEEAQ